MFDKAQLNVLGRVRRGPEAGRFVELIEDRVLGCVRVFSYADQARSGEIFDGLFFSPDAVKEYLKQAMMCDIEWGPAL